MVELEGELATKVRFSNFTPYCLGSYDIIKINVRGVQGLGCSLENFILTGHNNKIFTISFGTPLGVEEGAIDEASVLISYTIKVMK